MVCVILKFQYILLKFQYDIYHCCVYSGYVTDSMLPVQAWTDPCGFKETEAARFQDNICPKHVQFYFKNKFEKLVHLVGFITGINK